MFSSVVPADVHQLDGVERAPSIPRRPGAMRGLAVEEKLDRHQAAAEALAPTRAQSGPDVAIEHRVDIVEQPGSYEVRLGPELFFGDPGPELQCAADVLALHDLLHRECGGHDQGLAGIVSLTVSRRADHQRVAVGDPRFLGGLWNPVNVGAQRDDR